MRKVLNLINPDRTIQETLPSNRSRPYSSFTYITSDKPLPYSDLLVFPFEKFNNFSQSMEITYIPFLLYGHIEFIDRAFSQGAVDFIKFPFSFQELEARAQRIIRKNKFSFNDIFFEFQQTHIMCNSRFEPLSDREFQLLSLLIANSGSIVNREGILYRLDMGRDETRALDVYINSLRNKLDRVSRSRELGKFIICTVRGKGYTINSQINCG